MRAGGDFWGEENILYSGFACAGISAFFFRRLYPSSLHESFHRWAFSPQW